jgi:hypothetical protein
MKQALLTPKDIKSFIYKVVKADERLTVVDVLSIFHLKHATLKKYIKMGLPWYGVKTRKEFLYSEVKEWLVKNTDKLTYENFIV